jgi:hypothetical protein
MDGKEENFEPFPDFAIMGSLFSGQVPDKTGVNAFFTLCPAPQSLFLEFRGASCRKGSQKIIWLIPLPLGSTMPGH